MVSSVAAWVLKCILTLYMRYSITVGYIDPSILIYIYIEYISLDIIVHE